MDRVDGVFRVRLTSGLPWGGRGCVLVRGKLAPYEYPKEVEFVDALPMTTTGKVQRRVLRVLEEQRAATAGSA